MHVVFFGDQHAESSGGAQVSMRLQRRFLERAGHTVTIVAPRTRAAHPGDPAYLDLPSVPVTLDGEYALSWPGRRTDRWLDAALAGRPRVDLVHVQADFWGAMIGHRFAARRGLPVVHTMHNRVDVGIRATAPAPGLVLRVLNAWARRQLRGVPPRDGRGIAPPSHDSAGAVRQPHDPATAERDGWAYLRRFAARADAVTAPSSHFARRLREHGCGVVDVVWNGIDDGLLDAAITVPPSERTRPRLVWIGRMSPEKRLLPFLEAVAESGIDAEVEVIGGGGQQRAAQRLVARLRPAASVVFPGRLPYAETLARIASADAVVQTSIGFETQGMTVFEAAALGTPAVVSDPDIADELGAGVWRTADGSVAALAATLRQAVAEIAAGTAPVPDPSVASRFRQSSRTAAMLALYDEVLARR